MTPKKALGGIVSIKILNNKRPKNQNCIGEITYFLAKIGFVTELLSNVVMTHLRCKKYYF